MRIKNCVDATQWKGGKYMRDFLEVMYNIVKPEDEKKPDEDLKVTSKITNEDVSKIAEEVINRLNSASADIDKPKSDIIEDVKETQDIDGDIDVAV